MILDNQASYAMSQTVTAVGDTPSTNVIDHGPGNSGPGMAGLFLVVKVESAFTSGGAATLQPVLQDSADNTAWADVMGLTAPLPLASLAARRAPVAHARLPGRLRRYTRIVWRVAGAAFTSGTISASSTFEGDLQWSAPSGFGV